MLSAKIQQVARIPTRLLVVEHLISTGQTLCSRLSIGKASDQPSVGRNIPCDQVLYTLASERRLKMSLEWWYGSPAWVIQVGPCDCCTAAVTRLFAGLPPLALATGRALSSCRVRCGKRCGGRGIVARNRRALVSYGSIS